MSVDVEALKALAQEKKLPLERLINAIKQSFDFRFDFRFEYRFD